MRIVVGSDDEGDVLDAAVDEARGRGHELTVLPQAQWPDVAQRVADANEAEAECARILDFHGIAWEYEPHSFVLEQDEAGRVLEAFTPDFYLTEQDAYLEVTVMKQSLVTRKHRKIRKLRERLEAP